MTTCMGIQTRQVNLQAQRCTLNLPGGHYPPTRAPLLCFLVILACFGCCKLPLSCSPSALPCHPCLFWMSKTVSCVPPSVLPCHPYLFCCMLETPPAMASFCSFIVPSHLLGVTISLIVPAICASSSCSPFLDVENIVQKKLPPSCPPSVCHCPCHIC